MGRLICKGWLKMVEGKPNDRESKKEVKRRRESSSTSSSDSSSESSETSSFSDSSSSSRSATSSTTESSRSPTPRKATKDRARSPARRSRSPRAGARAERSEKAVIASSRRSPTPERRRRRSSPSPKRRPSPSPKRRDRSGSRDRDRRNRSRSRERKASPVRKATPPPRRLCVRNLSRNVTKEHLSEIFSVYGTLKTCELPMDRQHTHLGRGYGYVEFEQPEDAEKALKHMDGGQIDGQEVTCELTHPPRSALNGSGRRPLSPLRFRGLSPRRYRSPPRAHGTGGNMVPLGPSRFNRSRSRTPRRRRELGGDFYATLCNKP
ncbi:RNA-binding protein [Dirofilaria immitis]